MTHRRFPALALALVASTLPATLSPAARAAEPAAPGGWEAANLPALRDSADYDQRLAKGGGYLVAYGDYDGDGKIDRARLFTHRDAGKAALFVSLAQDSTPWAHKVAEVPLVELPRMGIATAPPATVQTACARGAGKADACGVTAVAHDADAVKFFAFESAAQLYTWNGRDFSGTWVSD